MPEGVATPSSRPIVLGFDFGLRFIGVASGNTLTRTASPLRHLNAREGVPDWQVVEALLKDWRPAILLVGLPVNMDGSESDMTQRARRFANRLHGRFGMPVELLDERLSTREARSLGAHRARGGGAIDSQAAVVIVEQWLRDTAPRSGSP